jgi:hypothetical protein
MVDYSASTAFVVLVTSTMIGHLGAMIWLSVKLCKIEKTLKNRNFNAID